MSSDTSEGPCELEKKLYHLEGDIWLVPCIANYTTNAFQPLLQPISDEEAFTEASKRKGWTELEDRTLLQIVQNRGPSSWGLIARELNSLLYGGKKAKIGRQCRERWNNHVDPSIIKGNWTLDEDIYILEMQLKHGNKWSEVARGLTGRTENSVKNRWKSMIKKAMRDWPQGFDVVNLLLAEKKKLVIETNTGNAINLSSPVITHESFLEKSPMQTHEVRNLQPHFENYNVNPNSVNLVRNRLAQFDDLSNRMDEDMYSFDGIITGDTRDQYINEFAPEQTPSPSIFLRFA